MVSSIKFAVQHRCSSVTRSSGFFKRLKSFLKYYFPAKSNTHEIVPSALIKTDAFAARRIEPAASRIPFLLGRCSESKIPFAPIVELAEVGVVNLHVARSVQQVAVHVHHPIILSSDCIDSRGGYECRPVEPANKLDIRDFYNSIVPTSKAYISDAGADGNEYRALWHTPIIQLLYNFCSTPSLSMQ